MTPQNPVVNAISSLARKYGVDPAAVLAVASVEGGLRTGAVGDQGTSFGPLQLHVGGALPAGRGATWANSPAGLEYAIQRIASSGARGKTGRAAIESIVRNFERPADPTGEVQRALSHYTGVVPVLPGTRAGLAETPLSPSPVAASAPDRSGLLASLINSTNELIGLPTVPFPAQIPSVGGSPPASSGAPPTTPAPTQPKGKRLSTIAALEQFTAPFGVKVTSTTEGQHVPGSYHYRSRAIDVAGTPDQMRAVALAALAHPEQYREMFYDPLGVYIKNGRVVRGAIGGHSDHVHLAR